MIFYLLGSESDSSFLVKNIENAFTSKYENSKNDNT